VVATLTRSKNNQRFKSPLWITPPSVSQLNPPRPVPRSVAQTYGPESRTAGTGRRVVVPVSRTAGLATSIPRRMPCKSLGSPAYRVIWRGAGIADCWPLAAARPSAGPGACTMFRTNI